MKAEFAYYERQRIQPYLMLTLLGLAVLSSVLIKLTNPATPFAIAAAPTALIVMLVTLVSFPTIETIVDDAEVRVRLAPFPFARIPFEEIVSVESVKYRPLIDYGGWGLRYGWKGWAYNASGNRGVMIRMKRHAEGNGILIGSQRPDELCYVISRRVSASSNPPRPTE